MRKKLAIAVAISLALAFAPLAGCGESSPPAGDNGKGGNAIPIETLAEGFNSEYGRIDEIPIPEEAPPECLAISDKEEFQRLLSQAYFQEPVPEVDFEAHIVIAAMQGPKNTGGYSIFVSSAFQDGGEVRVGIDVVEPEPGAMTVQVLTSPYHLVVAERGSFDPRGELFFVFVDQHGELISQLFAEV